MGGARGRPAVSSMGRVAPAAIVCAGCSRQCCVALASVCRPPFDLSGSHAVLNTRTAAVPCWTWLQARREVLRPLCRLLRDAVAMCALLVVARCAPRRVVSQWEHDWISPAWPGPAQPRFVWRGRREPAVPATCGGRCCFCWAPRSLRWGPYKSLVLAVVHTCPAPRAGVSVHGPVGKGFANGVWGWRSGSSRRAAVTCVPAPCCGMVAGTAARRRFHCLCTRWRRHIAISKCWRWGAWAPARPTNSAAVGAAGSRSAASHCHAGLLPAVCLRPRVFSRGD
jgi:hypothetical protein